jgi:hypothetical protein
MKGGWYDAASDTNIASNRGMWSVVSLERFKILNPCFPD